MDSGLGIVFLRIAFMSTDRQAYHFRILEFCPTTDRPATSAGPRRTGLLRPGGSVKLCSRPTVWIGTLETYCRGPEYSGDRYST